MAAEFKLPDLGENIEKGEVINVLVSVGETLTEDQPVVELETDKAVIEVPSSVSGTIAAIHVSQGDTVSVGQPILVVDGDAPAAAPATAVAAATPAPAPVAPAPVVPAPVTSGPTGPQDVLLPELGEGVDGGDVVGIMVSVGDQVEVEQGLLELEIDKGVVELPAPMAGTVTAIHVKEGDRADVGQLMLTLEVTAGASAAPAAPPAAATPATAPAPSPAPATVAQTTSPTPSPATAPVDLPARKLVPAAPSVRRLAREIGVDIGGVKGQGPGGRISEVDVKSHSKQLHESRGTSGGGMAVPAIDLPDFSKWGDVELEPFSNVRRITAQRMVHSWTSIPHVTQFDQADVTDLEAFRKKHGKAVEKAGGKLTPTALILKVVATALRKFPQFCASIDMASEQVIYKNYQHIGVAVDTKRGLLVPVIRDVSEKTVTEISIELTQMAEKTRTGRVAIEEMQGGCFTISNLGGIGGTAFTPIVNAPEVAILGVARSKTEPVYIEGQFQPRLIMPLSLSYDHRLIDGADGARFLRFICEGLENPFYLAFEG